MDKEEQDILYIEQYLENKLSQQERIAFEVRLKSDAAFQKLMKQTKLLISGIEHSGRNELLMKLKGIEETMPDISAPEDLKVFSLKDHKYRYWALAACISLLLLVSVFGINYYLTSSPSALYEAYYIPYPNIVYPVQRGDLDRVGDREFAYQAYDLQDYERAVQLFENIPQYELKVEDLLYLGISYLATDNSEKASLTFEKLLDTYPLFNIQAKWYLSLSYLRQGKTKASKRLLQEIKTDNTSYSEKAGELLQAME